MWVCGDLVQQSPGKGFRTPSLLTEAFFGPLLKKKNKVIKHLEQCRFVRCKGAQMSHPEDNEY